MGIGHGSRTAQPLRSSPPLGWLRTATRSLALCVAGNAGSAGSAGGATLVPSAMMLATLWPRLRCAPRRTSAKTTGMPSRHTRPSSPFSRVCPSVCSPPSFPPTPPHLPPPPPPHPPPLQVRTLQRREIQARRALSDGPVCATTQRPPPRLCPLPRRCHCRIMPTATASTCATMRTSPAWRTEQRQRVKSCSALWSGCGGGAGARIKLVSLCLLTPGTLSPSLPCSRPRPPSPPCPPHRALPRGSARSLPQHRRLVLDVATGQADIESLQWPTWAAVVQRGEQGQAQVGRGRSG